MYHAYLKTYSSNSENTAPPGIGHTNTGGWNIPLQNMPLRHKDYFKPKEFTQRIQAACSVPPLRQPKSRS